MKKRLLLMLLLVLPMGATFDTPRSCSLKRGIVFRIMHREGGDRPGTLPWELKNPCSLVWANQYGSHRHRSGFAEFDSRELGLSACDKQVSKILREKRSFKKAWAYL